MQPVQNDKKKCCYRITWTAQNFQYCQIVLRLYICITVGMKFIIFALYYTSFATLSCNFTATGIIYTTQFTRQCWPVANYTLIDSHSKICLCIEIAPMEWEIHQSDSMEWKAKLCSCSYLLFGIMLINDNAKNTYHCFTLW